MQYEIRLCLFFYLTFSLSVYLLLQSLGLQIVQKYLGFAVAHDDQ